MKIGTKWYDYVVVWFQTFYMIIKHGGIKKARKQADRECEDLLGKWRLLK